MKVQVCCLFALLTIPSPIRSEVEAILSAADIEEMVREEARAEARHTERRISELEAVPALAEWEVVHPDSTTVLRRVQPPRHRRAGGGTVQQPAVMPSATFEDAPVDWREHRMITLAATVYDGVLSDIRWRDADGGIWTVISNVDMRVFRSMTDFSDESGHWTLFLFVDELIEDFTDSAQTGGADTGLLTSTASLSPVELAALGAEKPAYVVLGLEGQLAPSALHEELGALHRHYAANREALLIRYRNAAALEEERRAWRDANPPSPRATVINFWKIK